MVLQKLIEILLRHPRYGPEIVQRLSETRVIRQAARFTAYLFLKGKSSLENQSRTGRFQPQGKSKFLDTFRDELRKGWEEQRKKM